MQSVYLNAIQRFEGFAARAQWDYAQFSNGFGTKAQHPGEVIDVVEAERRFNQEISKAEGLVERFAPGLDSGTKAALTSLTFNAGTKWMNSGLGTAVRTGDLATARDLFLQYTRAGGEVLPGLVSRRVQEANWFPVPGEVPATEVVIAEDWKTATSRPLFASAEPNLIQGFDDTAAPVALPVALAEVGTSLTSLASVIKDQVQASLAQMSVYLAGQGNAVPPQAGSDPEALGAWTTVVYNAEPEGAPPLAAVALQSVQPSSSSSQTELSALALADLDELIRRQVDRAG